MSVADQKEQLSNVFLVKTRTSSLCFESYSIEKIGVELGGAAAAASTTQGAGSESGQGSE